MRTNVARTHAIYAHLQRRGCSRRGGGLLGVEASLEYGWRLPCTPISSCDEQRTPSQPHPISEHAPARSYLACVDHPGPKILVCQCCHLIEMVSFEQYGSSKSGKGFFVPWQQRLPQPHSPNQDSHHDSTAATLSGLMGNVTACILDHATLR